MEIRSLLSRLILGYLIAIPACQCFRGGWGERGRGGEGERGDDEESERTSAKNESYPHQLPAEVRLIKDLLERYPAVRALARPVLNPADQVVVSLRVALIQILKFDEKNQAIQIMVWKELRWVDQLLTWDPDSYEGIEEVFLPADRVWKPDVILYSHVGSPDVEKNAELQMQLSHNGSITWLPCAVYTSSCVVDMTHFPYDKQTCKLKFGPWSYTRQKIDLVLFGAPEMNLEYYVRSSQWDVLDNTAVRNSYKYHCCSDEFTDITYTLQLKRNAGFHIKMLLLPTLLLSTLVLVIWWIPPQRPDRTSLGMSLFSSFVLLLLVILESSPPTAAAHLGTYCCSSIVLVTLATIISAVIVNLAAIKRPMHPTIKKIFIQYLGPKLHACAAPMIRSRSSSTKNCTVAESHQSESQPMADDAIPDKAIARLQPGGADWIIVAAVFDRLFFFIYTVVILMLVAAVFPWPV